MTARETALWLLDDICIVHTGFDKLALRKLIDGLDDRFIRIDNEGSSIEAVIQVPTKNEYYTISPEKITRVEQYRGGGRTKTLIRNLAYFLNSYEDKPKIKELIFSKYQDRIDAIYTGIKQFKSIPELEKEYERLVSDALDLESESLREDAINTLQSAGFTICEKTKNIITEAIDNYLANNEKTINDLD